MENSTGNDAAGAAVAAEPLLFIHGFISNSLPLMQKRQGRKQNGIS